MSCSSTSNKTCHDKSCQRYYNNNPQTLTAGGTLQLTIAGNRVVDSGIAIETEPQNFTTVKTGLYHIAGDIVINATAVGIATYAVYMDGVMMPCTLKTVTLNAGDTAIHTETDIRIEACCCNVNHSFAFVLASDGNLAGAVIESCHGMLKLA